MQSQLTCDNIFFVRFPVHVVTFAFKADALYKIMELQAKFRTLIKLFFLKNRTIIKLVLMYGATGCGIWSLSSM